AARSKELYRSPHIIHRVGIRLLSVSNEAIGDCEQDISTLREIGTPELVDARSTCLPGATVNRNEGRIFARSLRCVQVARELRAVMTTVLQFTLHVVFRRLCPRTRTHSQGSCGDERKDKRSYHVPSLSDFGLNPGTA